MFIVERGKSPYTHTPAHTWKIRNRKPSNKKPTEAISENEMKNHEWPTSERLKGVQIVEGVRGAGED